MSEKGKKSPLPIRNYVIISRNQQVSISQVNEKLMNVPSNCISRSFRDLP